MCGVMCLFPRKLLISLRSPIKPCQPRHIHAEHHRLACTLHKHIAHHSGASIRKSALQFPQITCKARMFKLVWTSGRASYSLPHYALLFDACWNYLLHSTRIDSAACFFLLLISCCQITDFSSEWIWFGNVLLQNFEWREILNFSTSPTTFRFAWFSLNRLGGVKICSFSPFVIVVHNRLWAIVGAECNCGVF